jgi:hypothetical protein
MAAKNTKRFVESTKYELVVKDDNGVIGTVLVKPNGVGWALKGAKGADKFTFVEWDVLAPTLKTLLNQGQATTCKQ